jgi:hypothetical protein
MEAEIKTGLIEVEPTDLEANPDEMKSVAEQQEVLKEDAAVETIRALEDRYGDRHLAVRHRRKPKKRTQGNGGSRKKLAAARRRMTHRAVPAWRKGCGHISPTVEKKRRKKWTKQGVCCTKST